MTNHPKSGIPEKHSRLGWGLALILLSLFIFGKPAGEALFEGMKTDETQWQKMLGSLSDILVEYPGEVGIYIKDLNTGKSFEWNADRKFLSASLIKIPIMAAVFKAVYEKKISLQSNIRLKSRHRKGGSGKMKWAYSGKEFPLSFVIYKMITHSDNTAAAMLIDRLGYLYLNRCFREFGLHTTRIDPAGMSLANHIHPARDNYTTPREMGYLLERIYGHKLVSDGLSDLMLEILKDADSPSRLARFLPDEFDLARKTGLLRNNCHDVGIVFTRRGDFVICVLTKENESYEKAKGLISSVGKSAYTYLKKRGQV